MKKKLVVVNLPNPTGHPESAICRLPESHHLYLGVFKILKGSCSVGHLWCSSSMFWCFSFLLGSVKFIGWAWINLEFCIFCVCFWGVFAVLGDPGHFESASELWCNWLQGVSLRGFRSFGCSQEFGGPRGPALPLCGSFHLLTVVCGTKFGFRHNVTTWYRVIFITGTPQFQYQKENRQAANHGLS